MFAPYASLSRLTSVRSDSGRFDSFVMVMFSPWYAGSQRVLRDSGCDFAAIGASGFLNGVQVWDLESGQVLRFACGCAGIGVSLVVFVFYRSWLDRRG